MRIIVDAMGGDHAPRATVRGALRAVEEYGVEVVLVGRGEDILAVFQEDGMAELPAGIAPLPASVRCIELWHALRGGWFVAIFARFAVWIARILSVAFLWSAKCGRFLRAWRLYALLRWKARKVLFGQVVIPVLFRSEGSGAVRKVGVHGRFPVPIVFFRLPTEGAV